MESFAQIQRNVEAVLGDLRSTEYSLGPILDYDPVTERFLGDGEEVETANAMQTRPYREPWIVPDAV